MFFFSNSLFCRGINWVVLTIVLRDVKSRYLNFRCSRMLDDFGSVDFNILLHTSKAPDVLWQKRPVKNTNYHQVPLMVQKFSLSFKWKSSPLTISGGCWGGRRSDFLLEVINQFSILVSEKVVVPKNNMFTSTWGNHPVWLMSLKGVETTNQFL